LRRPNGQIAFLSASYSQEGAVNIKQALALQVAFRAMSAEDLQQVLNRIDDEAVLYRLQGTEETIKKLVNEEIARRKLQ
jgi:hypothetical protein